MTEEIKIDVPAEVKNVCDQLLLIQEFVDQDFCDSVKKQAQVRAMHRMLLEKRQELEDTISACSLSGDLDGVVAANSTLQGLKMMHSEPIPEIPREAADKAYHAIRAAVMNSKMLTERSFPDSPKNHLLMLGRQHELRHATKNELLARHEYNEFQQAIYAWRNKLSGWMHKSISDPFLYVLEGSTLIAHDNVMILAEAERVSEIVKRGNADFRDLHKS